MVPSRAGSMVKVQSCSGLAGTLHGGAWGALGLILGQMSYRWGSALPCALPPAALPLFCDLLHHPPHPTLPPWSSVKQWKLSGLQ